MDIPVIPPLTLDKFNSIGEIYPIFPDEVYVGIDLARGKDITAHDGHKSDSDVSGVESDEC